MVRDQNPSYFLHTAGSLLGYFSFPTTFSVITIFQVQPQTLKKRDEERLGNTKARESATGRENYILFFTFKMVPNTNNYL